MTAERFSQALGGIGDAYVEEAANYTAERKRRPWIKWVSLAACLCVAVGFALRVSIAFVPSQATDVYREGVLVEIANESELPAKYSGRLLSFNLDFSSYDLYYKEGGTAENTADWYSLLAIKSDDNSRTMLYCIFGDGDVEDWKVDAVFTKEATRQIYVNGIRVLVAENVNSLMYEHWHYVIFKYDGVIYDLRVQSNDGDYVYEVLGELLKTE